MKRSHSRRRFPRFEALEGRLALSGLSGTWLGQDGQDLVGGSSQVGGNGIQDMHVRVDGLTPGVAVEAVRVEGLGGGTWQSGGATGEWAAVFLRTSPTSGSVFFEPYQVESGRSFQVTVRYVGGAVETCMVAGGVADPRLRLVANTLQVNWSGQDGSDLTGLGPSVGPDGHQDVRLRLANLAPGMGIESVRVDGALGVVWQSGLNHQAVNNAEVVRSASDLTRADVYFSPDRDLIGQALTVEVVYTSGMVDSGQVVASATDPDLPTPLPAPLPTRSGDVSGQWVGQDGADLIGPGAVRITLAGLAPGRTVVAAIVSDEAGATWSWKARAEIAVATDAFTRPLDFRRDGNGGELSFLPVRDESGGPLSLRLHYEDGSMSLTTIAGGPVDLARLVPRPASTSVTAQPGDDLQELADRFGTVRLSAGEYVLTRPLILSQAITITADAGATLVFSQGAAEPAWTAAIKVHAGNTTLDGFAVRFRGPVRWNWDVSYGPAVIGTTDEFDGPRWGPPLVDVVLTRLDLRVPPASSGTWERAPGLARLTGAESGRLENSVLVGGMIEFANGPWRFVSNDYQGTVAGTFADAVFAGHHTHDLLISENRIAPRSGAGKTWRFLVLTGSGFNDVIEANTVVGVGPRDDDAIPQMNAPEIILTESYRIKFEGLPSTISADRLIVQVTAPQGEAPRPGDGLAVLSGGGAGQWRRIVQVLDARTYVLDAPLPAGAGAISIASGFVNQVFRRNTIDARGSSTAADLVLVGNHFGLTVEGNRVEGGRTGLRLVASAAEAPTFWGWTHSPSVGVVVANNVFDAAAEAALIGVEHNSYTKAGKGRVYLSARVSDNTFGVQGGGEDVALVLGGLGSIDPDEAAIAFEGNRSATASARVAVPAARVNGQPLVDGTLTLTAGALSAPTGLRLESDTGVSATDRLTNESRLTFETVAGAAGYVYRVGADGPLVPIGTATSFQPVGLASSGRYTITVQAVDPSGTRGEAAELTIDLDLSPPPAVSGLEAPGDGRITFNAVGPDATYAYRVGTAGEFVAIGTSTSFVPAGPLPESALVAVRAIDAAGNAGPEASVVFDPEMSELTARWVGQDGRDYVGPNTLGRPDGSQDIHLVLGNLRANRAIVAVTISGLGGGVWSSTAANGAWRARVVHAARTRTADLYIQPYQEEEGRPFRIEVRYDDGVVASTWVQGGKASPNVKPSRAREQSTVSARRSRPTRAARVAVRPRFTR